MTDDVLIKWPSRGRPRLVAENLPRWNQGDVRFIFSLDSDDPALPAYRDVLYGLPNVKVCVGTSRNKVEAINRDLDGEPWDILVLASDDMVPQVSDWADQIRGMMQQYWPDGDGVLHLNDGRVGRRLNTLYVAGKKYFNRTGQIYYGLPKHVDGYTSVFCDDEFTEVSQRLNRSQYVDRVLIQHQWIGDNPDELCRRNESHYQRDGRVFAARKLAGFPTHRHAAREATGQTDWQTEGMKQE